MSMGLRVWDSAGNLKLDSNQRITRIVFEGYLTLVPETDNLIYISGLQVNSNWSAYCQAYVPSGGANLVSISTSLITNYVVVRLENILVNVFARLIVYRA